jgi:hypothetical protein
LIVVGAQRVDIDFTQVSMWERRIVFSGRSPNGTDPVARSALVRVDDTQSCPTRGAAEGSP